MSLLDIEKVERVNVRTDTFFGVPRENSSGHAGRRAGRVLVERIGDVSTRPGLAWGPALEGELTTHPTPRHLACGDCAVGNVVHESQ